MAQYKAFDTNVEVLGDVVLSVVAVMGAFKTIALGILGDHGIKDPRPDGWYPQQAFNIDEAVRAYTRWPAFAAFREQHTGILRRGYWADLTVMDIDPFVLSEADSSAILDGRIVMTIVDGHIVFER